MQLNRSDRRFAWCEVRSGDNQTTYPGHIDAYRFEKPCCFLFRRVEHVVSHGGIIEQFDRQPLPCGTSRALRCAQCKQKNKRDSSCHAGSVRTAAPDGSYLKVKWWLLVKPM